jgi:hypothetical protein
VTLGFLALNEIASWVASFPLKVGDSGQDDPSMNDMHIIYVSALPELLAKVLDKLSGVCGGEQAIEVPLEQAKKMRTRLHDFALTYRTRFAKVDEPSYFGILRVILSNVMSLLNDTVSALS